MRLLQILGFGEKRLFNQGHQVEGIISDIRKCWWIKINTKPVRAHALDGAVFPHIVTYQYTLAGQTYSGKRMIGVYSRCPQYQERVSIYYDPSKPTRSALHI